jgi:hypothetical protein
MDTQREQPQRQCPACGNDDTLLLQRGYAGVTDERDQYFVCDACGKTTYEIVSRTPKEIRIGRLEPGRPIRIEGSAYTISRVLKAGMNESLIYVKPSDDTEITPGKLSATSTRLRPRHR